VSRLDDVRRTIEGLLGTLTPAKAQELAKGMLEPGARKDQVAKAAGELVEWSQKNRERMRDLIRNEIRDQLQQVGVAPQSELDALKKRVRDLERAAGKTASGRAKRAGGKTAARSSAAKKAAAGTEG
jgi:polyhydroxyalkanoate synthesis regulator phasin